MDQVLIISNKYNKDIGDKYEYDDDINYLSIEKRNDSINTTSNINNKNDKNNNIDDDKEKTDKYKRNEENVTDNSYIEDEVINNNKKNLELNEFKLIFPTNDANYFKFENENLLEYYIKVNNAIY